MPRHAFDPMLKRKGWERLEFDMLPTTKANGVAVRMIQLIPAGADSRRALAMIDLTMWRQGQRAYFDIATTHVPPRLRTMAVQGTVGVTSLSLGLKPCGCRRNPSGNRRWSPLAMPLRWEQSMNQISGFTQVMNSFLDLVRTDKSWQCSDMRHLV